MQVHGARVRVELPGAEIVLLVALRDGHDDVVPRVCGRGSDPEDLSWDDDVGLEAEVVVGDPQRRVLAVQVVGAADPLAASGWWWGKRKTRRPLYSFYSLYSPPFFSLNTCLAWFYL